MALQIVFLVVGLALGFLIGYLLFKSKAESGSAIAEDRVKNLEQAAEELKKELSSERMKSENLVGQFSSVKNENENLIAKLGEQKLQMEELQTKFSKEFENLANRIFDEKSKKFSEQNEEKLGNILNPLKDRIQHFEKRVNDTHLESEKERSALKEQLRTMAEMNKRMSEEALNLTKALKGDSKKQGNWGEMILEKVLERSGLTKGREYDVQQSFTTEDGTRLQPDVVVRLPDNKNIIVDSKVSLVAYEKYVSTDDADNALQEVFLREHINSLRAHVKGLSGKNYQNLYGINSPDFVLLFVPIEPAFSLAVSHDNDLFTDAFDKNVVLVSPATLLATLRTIANVWKQEYQNKNSLEIAQQGADLYDKFVAFAEDMIKVGKHMDDSKKTYGEAMNKLIDGKGNLVKRAENMRKLGLKATKQLPQGLIDRADD